MPTAVLPKAPRHIPPPPTKEALDFADLAIIDLAKYSTPEGKSQLVEDVRNAMSTIGFFYVVNHGFSSEQTRRIFDIAEIPFTVSEEERQPYIGRMKETGSYQGYKPRQYWHIDAGVRDQIEQYNFHTNVYAKEHPLALRPFLPEIDAFARHTHYNVMLPLLSRFSYSKDECGSFLPASSGHPMGHFYRKTLSSLAQTCVMFKETALDLLWRDLKSLEPVIKILPKDLWTLRETRDRASWGEPTTCIISFTRMLKQQDLHRFDYYAPRVFGLACPEMTVRYLWRMKTAVYASFAFMRPGSPLLPNLRHACIRETASLSSSLFVLPSPTLVHLDIKTGFRLYDDKDNMGLYDQIANAFSSLPKLSPHLESLSLDIVCLKRFRPLLKSSIGVMIASLPKLHTLSMPDFPLFDETLLRKVGSHPKLRHWAVMLDPIEWLEERGSGSVRWTLAQFPELRSIKLTAGSLERLAAVIMILRLPLIDLELQVTESKRPLSLDSFVLFAWKFSNSVCASTLTTLRLDIDIAGAG
ncbi:hypothetical protein H0H93_012534 [Arthromyces matolae]|nr:hypothetical protein H0H93_012534 [Arthromyces matolae]